MLSSLSSAMNLLLVVIGFGLVIVVHELGHFLAARWAGIRVFQFAIGFGPAIVAYRKGLGWRWGSTTPALRELQAGGGPAGGDASDPALPPGVSPTEYRLNWIPFGGYVKMLGQDDLAPGASSDNPDSYTAKPVWKRMVVISGGVVMNLVLAAALFVVVFMAGLPAPPAIVGDVAPDSPAAKAMPANAPEAGVTEPGLRPGDEIVLIGDRKPQSFNDLMVAAMMAKGGRPLSLVAHRPGVDEPLRFEVTPERTDGALGLQLGVYPSVSGEVAPLSEIAPESRDRFQGQLSARLPGVEPGMWLVSVDGGDASTYADLDRAVRGSGGAPVTAVFEGDAGNVTVQIAPARELEIEPVPIGADEQYPLEHLLGMTPPLRVDLAGDGAERAGLRTGDVFARVGSREWPDPAAAIREIRAHSGRQVSLTVMREGEYVSLEAPVSTQGLVGFAPGNAAEHLTVVTFPEGLRTAAEEEPGAGPSPSPGASPEASPGASPGAGAGAFPGVPPGSIVERVGGREVADYHAIAGALREATREAHGAGRGADVPLTIRLPLSASFGRGPVEEHVWRLTPAQVRRVHALGWTNPVSPALFTLETRTLRAAGPVEAIVMGVRETHRMVMMTYLTLVRLFEGTVEVQQLKGPVGIAHIGTQVVNQGMIYLLFFLAVISANLAVINFLPLPIVDGGQFVFLMIEGFTGRPVSVAVQNAAALLGLALIGVMFFVVTYNDIAAIING